MYACLLLGKLENQHGYSNIQHIPGMSSACLETRIMIGNLNMVIIITLLKSISEWKLCTMNLFNTFGVVRLQIFVSILLHFFVLAQNHSIRFFFNKLNLNLEKVVNITLNYQLTITALLKKTKRCLPQS